MTDETVTALHLYILPSLHFYIRPPCTSIILRTPRSALRTPLPAHCPVAWRYLAPLHLSAPQEAAAVRSQPAKRCPLAATSAPLELLACTCSVACKQALVVMLARLAWVALARPNRPTNI